ncbi:transposase-like protein [Colletotrichum incanum]|uniref:Transposase-like protein n=1 Tax=Colletotrichum incanum TaxID=1573173 RepID=A0A162PLX1_COLIC|nr:transposase-like protein [Colletotrichum incanum]
MSTTPSPLDQATPSSSAFGRLRQPKSISEQLEEAKKHPEPDIPTIDTVYKFTINNKTYVQEELLWRKGQRGRTSWINQHGWFFVSCHEGRPGASFWACRHCDLKKRAVLFDAKASSSASDHLRKIHHIVKSSDSTDSEASSDVSLKRPRLDFTGLTKKKVKTIQESTVGLVVDANLPFSFFQNSYFQSLVAELNPQVFNLPWGRTSLNQSLIDLFNAKKEEVKKELSRAATSIHLSFDLWTSSNRHAIMAVTAHFILKEKGPQVRLIALRNQLGAHDGENLASTLEEVIDEWDIRSGVGVIVADNASSNDTCLRHLYNRLDPSMTESDKKARRLRCFGHILNLVSKAFLYGNDADSFERQSDAYRLLQQDKQDLRHWRKKGPVGKLHNIVKFIRSSPQRTQRFKKISQEEAGHHPEDFLLSKETPREVELILDNATRWNSTYLMIERAIRLQDEVDAFCGSQNNPDPIPNDDILSTDDWR